MTCEYLGSGGVQKNDCGFDCVCKVCFSRLFILFYFFCSPPPCDVLILSPVFFRAREILFSPFLAPFRPVFRPVFVIIVVVSYRNTLSYRRSQHYLLSIRHRCHRGVARFVYIHILSGFYSFFFFLIFFTFLLPFISCENTRILYTGKKYQCLFPHTLVFYIYTYYTYLHHEL